MPSMYQEVRNEGFYLKNGEDAIKVSYSSKGPLLTVNDESYPLSGDNWDVEFYAGKVSHVFVLYWEGQVKLSVRYPANLDLLMNLYHYLQWSRVNKQLA